MAKIYLNHRTSEDNVTFLFSKKGVILSSKKATLKEIEAHDIYNPDGKKISQYTLNSLLNVAENSLALDENKQEFTLPQVELFKLDDRVISFENMMQELGFPRVNVQMDLKEDGIIVRDDFRVNITFLYADGRPCFGQRHGIFIVLDNKPISLLSKQMFLISTHVEEMNKKNGWDSNFKGVSFLNELVDKEVNNATFSDYLKNTRVVHASKFTLGFDDSKDKYGFTPVLLQPSSNDQEEHTLLSPVQQQEFANELASKGAKSTYPLKDNTYLYIDPNLRKALDISHRISKSDEKTRLDFIKNPRSYINTINEDDENTADILEFIFVETPRYSERVESIGVWEKPKLPWIKIEGQKWIPNEDDFYIQTGKQVVFIKSNDIQQLKEKIQHTRAAGEDSIVHNGQTISITDDLIRKLEVPIPLIRPDGEIDEEVRKVTEGGGLKDKLVLFVKENFTETQHEDFIRSQRLGPRSPLPTNLKTTLRPHQKTGLMWLQETWKKGATGALLADDMGLGKTFQVLSFLSWVQEVDKKPILIVAPTSLLQNWEEEAEIHLREPFLGQVVKLYGADLRYLKHTQSKESEIGRPTLDINEIKSANWVVTSYETMRDYEHSLGAVKFSVVVFDEMQKIKNPSALVTKAAKALNTDFKVGLTGTPVENRLSDLHTISDILRPGYFGDLSSFSKKYESPSVDEDVLLELRTRLEDSNKGVPSLMLRRMKFDVLNDGTLKEKVIVSAPSMEDMRVTMPEKQRASYDNIIKQYKDKDEAGSMLEAIQGLRNISLCYEDPDLSDSDPEDLFANSAKLNKVVEILNSISKQSEKAILFIESRKIQTLLQGYIQRKFAFRPNIINGQTPSVKRQEYVNTFEAKGPGFDVIILSPKAAGTGFTLVAANHVIHLSRWWNPAIEDQATDRAYRIGQKKKVYVYYPLAIHPEYGDDSFDIKLDKLIQRKRDLSNKLLLPIDPIDEQFGDKSSVSELYEGTVKAEKKPTIEVNFDLINDGIQFEEYIAKKFKEVGFQTYRTPPSNDKGVDVVAKREGLCLLIQCKFSHDQNMCTQDPVKDLLGSSEHYMEDNKTLKLVAITNAKDFRDGVKYRASECSVQIVTGDTLADVLMGYKH